MHVQQVIETRRSIRSYTEQPVPVELVEVLLETAMYAPNHKLREPWRFVLAIEEGQTRYGRCFDGVTDSAWSIRDENV